MYKNIFFLKYVYKYDIMNEINTIGEWFYEKSKMLHIYKSIYCNAG